MFLRPQRWVILFLLSWGTCNLAVLGQTTPTWEWQFAVQSRGAVIRSERSTVDANGNILVVGTFTGELTFAPLIALIGGANDDIFVAKFAARTGQCLWARRAGGDGYEEGRGIAVTPTGDVLITGKLQVMPAHFGDLPELVPKSRANLADLFVAKLDGRTGTWLWAVSTGSEGWGIGRGIASDATGNAIVTGEFSGYLNFGATQLASSNGSTDIFLAAFKGDNGQALWAISAGGNGLDIGLSVAVDATGDFVVTGLFDSVAAFSPGQACFTQRPGEQGSFIAKVAGQPARWQWVQALSGERTECAGLALDATGNILSTGFFQGTLYLGTNRDKEAELILEDAISHTTDCYLTKLDGHGHFLWATRGGGLDNERGFAVVADPQGDVYATGFFTREAPFGPTVLRSPGTTVYVGKVSGQTGKWLGVTQTQNASLISETVSSSLHFRADGQLALSGRFRSRLSIGSDFLVSGEDYSLFVATLQPVLLSATATIAPTTASARLEFYPNPAHHLIQVSIAHQTAPVCLTLTNLLGQVMTCPRQQGPATSREASFSLAGIAPGVYWAEIINQGKTQRQRLTVE